MVCCHKIMKKRNGKKKGIQNPYEKILPPEPSHEEFIRMQLNLGVFLDGCVFFPWYISFRFLLFFGWVHPLCNSFMQQQ